MIRSICWLSPGSLNFPSNFLRAKSNSMFRKSSNWQNSCNILITFSLFFPKYSPSTFLSIPSIESRNWAMSFSSLLLMGFYCFAPISPCGLVFIFMMNGSRFYIACAGFLLNFSMNSYERLLLIYKLFMDVS